MRIVKVLDRDRHYLGAQIYDVAIYASGYEDRCVSLLSSPHAPRARSALVLGFSEVPDATARRVHDDEFEKAGYSIRTVGEDPEADIFGYLSETVPKFEQCRIVVDYSSMSRSWVNSILNFFKFSQGYANVELVFSYTVGIHVNLGARPRYPDSDYQVSSIESLSGLEGSSVRQRRTLAVVGLGFDWVSPFAACELVEPEEVKVFYAEPGAASDYGASALELNSSFLKERAVDRPVAFPLHSVEALFIGLGELVAPNIADKNAILIPLGPKPQVLGCILLANRLPDVTCLYVQGRHETVHQVAPAGTDNFVVTSVRLSDRSRNSLLEDDVD